MKNIYKIWLNNKANRKNGSKIKKTTKKLKKFVDTNNLLGYYWKAASNREDVATDLWKLSRNEIKQKQRQLKFKLKRELIIKITREFQPGKIKLK